MAHDVCPGEEDDTVALVRVYCGLASVDQATRPASAGSMLTSAVVDDSGRLLHICEISDDAAGYAELGALLVERSGGPSGAAIAADNDDHTVISLLSAAGRPLAIADDDSVDDFAERFADDESVEEIQSPPDERRAVGLARALQAGALSAAALPAPREFANYKPVLAAHAALASGRHSTAVTLREVLRELYPAALRAYPDPAEPVSLAVLDALPEPGMLGAGLAPGGRASVAADAIAAHLAADGVADADAITEAVTALQVAIAETPRRAAGNKALTSAVAETVRQAVAAVRACDAACDALVATLTARVSAPAPTANRRPIRRTTPAGSTAPTSGPPATRLHPVHPASPEPAPTPGRPGQPESAGGNGIPLLPQPMTPLPVAPAPIAPPPVAPSPIAPAASTPTPVAPVTAPPAQTSPAAPTPVAPVAPVTAPPAQTSPAAPTPVAPAASLLTPAAPVTAPPAQTSPAAAPARVPEPSSPVAPAARREPPADQPASAPAGRPVSAPPPPPGITPIAPVQRGGIPPADAGEPFRATLTTAAINSARAERQRPTPITPRPRTKAEPAPPATGFRATDLTVPVPASRPEPEPAPPGSRANWPLVSPSDDPGPTPYGVGDRAPAGVDAPTDPGPGDARIAPPWLADDLPPEPPMLRLVEPPPLADRALRDGPSTPAGSHLETPPLRLVEPENAHRKIPAEQPSPGAVERGTPPVADEGDGDLLIFAAARSAWFTGQSEETEVNWSSTADSGWQAAEQAARPAVGDETRAGLPKRVPQANLVPGSPLRDERPLRIVRDAASLAQNTTGYFQGWRRGQEIGGYAVGGRPGREAAGGWDFSRDPGIDRDENREYEYRSAGRRS